MTLLSLVGCADLARRAEANNRFYEAQAAALASELVYNVGLPSLWDGQQTTYGQGALQVDYTCLDMKLAQMAAKKFPAKP
jgi:hypothetical protein